nr:hypothetical protein [Bifidobacterium catenulatum]
MVKLSELHAAPGCDYTGTPLPENYVKKLKAVTAKRAGSVIAAMLKNGSVKQAELEAMGYTHGPRAVRDVRELGFGVVTVRGADGFAIYAFDDPANNINQLAKSKGRTVLEKELRTALVAQYGARDFITLEHIDEDQLQVDHRVPYEIGGEPDHSDLTQFMLLSGSSNRLKSHTCENCPNWMNRDVTVCESCFWAHPENYTHAACREERPLLLMFSSKDADILRRAQETYGDALMEKAKKSVVEAFTLALSE